MYMYFYIINSPIHLKYYISDSIEIYKIYLIFNLFHYIQINIICNINYFI